MICFEATVLSDGFCIFGSDNGNCLLKITSDAPKVDKVGLL
jgi:hypothetical protein